MLELFFLIMCVSAGWLLGRGIRVLERGRSNGRFGLKEWTILFGMLVALHGSKRISWLDELYLPVLVIGCVLMLVIAGWVSEIFNGYE